VNGPGRHGARGFTRRSLEAEGGQVRSLLIGVVVAATFSIAVTLAQAPAPTLQILEPHDGEYITGEVRIRAEIRPSTQPVERMIFFVDGRLSCTVDAPPFECVWNAGSDVRAHVFRVVSVLPGGERLRRSVRTRGEEYVERSGVDMVHVTATVFDGTRLVQWLQSEAFHVFEDGRPQPITHFAAENIPLELVIAIDISDSMALSIGRVKEYVKSFVSALRPKDRVTLAVFNEHFFVLTALTAPAVDLADRLKALDRLAPSGSTSLHEAIVKSFDLLSNEKRRRGLIVFTDGDDTSSRVPRDAVERRSETSDAVLYMIGQGEAVKSAGLKALCDRLADRSGGRAFFPRQTDEVAGVFDVIRQEMSNQYFLTYPAPSTTRDARFHRIRVEVDGGYEVRARQGYRLVDR
jgi:Ca-activated chloride channel family protein